MMSLGVLLFPPRLPFGGVFAKVVFPRDPSQSHKGITSHTFNIIIQSQDQGRHGFQGI